MIVREACGISIASAVLLLATGCNSGGPAGGGGGGGSVNPASSSLAPGSYSGDIESTTRIFVDGVEQDAPLQSTQQIQETIDSTGVPVLSSGEPIQVSDVVVLAEAGENRLVATVSSIVDQSDGLVLNFDIDGQVDGSPVTGSGQTVYEKQDDGSLLFDLDFDFSGVDGDGRVVRQTEQRRGVLTPVS
jgi:hypothetical protein